MRSGFIAVLVGEVLGGQGFHVLDHNSGESHKKSGESPKQSVAK